MRNFLIKRVVSRLPILRALPIFRLLAIAEIAILARDHLGRLQPAERRRLLELVREGRGRGSNLPAAEREELAKLVAKVDPRRFGWLAADKLSPVPLPKRLVEGRRPPSSEPH